MMMIRVRLMCILWTILQIFCTFLHTYGKLKLDFWKWTLNSYETLYFTKASLAWVLWPMGNLAPEILGQSSTVGKIIRDMEKFY